MENIILFLEKPLITFDGNIYTLFDVLLAPTLVLLGFIFIGWSSRLLKKVMRRKQMNADGIQVIYRAYLILTYAMMFMGLLSLLHIPITAFAFISGAIAIGFGFGAQNIINNFISGWILMWERPIHIGDFLEMGDIRGTVEAVNTRSTRIRRNDGVHILIPNSFLLENTVINWTLVDNLMRTTVRVGVAYGSPVRKVQELLLQAAEEHPQVNADPTPRVIFEDFGDNALVFDINVWTSTVKEVDLRHIRSDLRFRIEELFDEAGIVVAYPQRDIHVDGSINIIKS